MQTFPSKKFHFCWNIALPKISPNRVQTWRSRSIRSLHPDHKHTSRWPTLSILRASLVCVPGSMPGHNRCLAWHWCLEIFCLVKQPGLKVVWFLAWSGRVIMIKILLYKVTSDIQIGTPSGSFYSAHWFCRKSNFAKFDQIYIKNY